ncbi:unnamed protein product, partial [Meganyctiphanes norvegica]
MMHNNMAYIIYFTLIVASYDAAFGAMVKPDVSLHSRSSVPCVNKASEMALPVGQTVTFTSPNYPNNYDQKSNCGWKFKTDKGATLELTCEDFSLRPQTKKGECRDFFKTNDYKTVTKYCGDDNPSGFVSNGRRLNLLFNSGKKKLSTGFSCSLTAKGPPTTTIAAPAADCNHDLIVSVGMDETWSSPGYPGGYPEGISCTLTITGIPHYSGGISCTVTIMGNTFSTLGCIT